MTLPATPDASAMMPNVLTFDESKPGALSCIVRSLSAMTYLCHEPSAVGVKTLPTFPFAAGSPSFGDSNCTRRAPTPASAFIWNFRLSFTQPPARLNAGLMSNPIPVQPLPHSFPCVHLIALVFGSGPAFNSMPTAD